MHIQIFYTIHSGSTILEAFTLQNTHYSAAHRHGWNIPGHSSGVSQETGRRIYAAWPQKRNTQEGQINFSDCWQLCFPKALPPPCLSHEFTAWQTCIIMMTSCCSHWGPSLTTMPGWQLTTNPIFWTVQKSNSQSVFLLSPHCLRIPWPLTIGTLLMGFKSTAQTVKLYTNLSGSFFCIWHSEQSSIQELQNNMKKKKAQLSEKAHTGSGSCSTPKCVHTLFPVCEKYKNRTKGTPS